MGLSAQVRAVVTHRVGWLALTFVTDQDEDGVPCLQAACQELDCIVSDIIDDRGQGEYRFHPEPIQPAYRYRSARLWPNASGDWADGGGRPKKTRLVSSTVPLGASGRSFGILRFVAEDLRGRVGVLGSDSGSGQVGAAHDRAWLGDVRRSRSVAHRADPPSVLKRAHGPLDDSEAKAWRPGTRPRYRA